MRPFEELKEELEKASHITLTKPDSEEIQEYEEIGYYSSLIGTRRAWRKKNNFSSYAQSRNKQARDRFRIG